MEDLESRWNFSSPDLLNILLQIKPTEQNLSIYSQIRASFISLVIEIDLRKIGWATDISLLNSVNFKVQKNLNFNHLYILFWVNFWF